MMRWCIRVLVGLMCFAGSINSAQSSDLVQLDQYLSQERPMLHIILSQSPNVPQTGDTIELTITSPFGFSYLNRLYIAADSPYMVDINEALHNVRLPATVRYQIPPEALGSLSIRAFGSVNGEAVNLKSNGIILQTVTDAKIQGIESVGRISELMTNTIGGAAGSRHRLMVYGRFSDGQKRDVTDAITGTVYQSSNPSVVEISRSGVLTYHSPGTSIVTVSNGGYHATRVLSVGASDVARNMALTSLQ